MRVGRLLHASGWLIAQLDRSGRRDALVATSLQAISIGFMALFLVLVVEALRLVEGGESTAPTHHALGVFFGGDPSLPTLAAAIAITGTLGAALLLSSQILILKVARSQHINLCGSGLCWLASRNERADTDVKRLIVAARMSALGTRVTLGLPSTVLMFCGITALLLWMNPIVASAAIAVSVPGAFVIYILNIRAARIQREYLENRSLISNRFRELTNGETLPPSPSDFENDEVSPAFSSLWGRLRIQTESQAVPVVTMAVVLSLVFAFSPTWSSGTGAIGLVAFVLVLRVGLGAFGKISTSITTFSRYFKEIEWLIGVKAKRQLDKVGTPSMNAGGTFNADARFEEDEVDE